MVLLAADFSNQTEFARFIGRDRAQVSRFIGKNSNATIGDIIARHVEKAFKKERGWLDIDHSIPPNYESKINLDVLEQVIEIYGIIKKVKPNVSAKTIADMYEFVMKTDCTDEKTEKHKPQVLQFKQLAQLVDVN